MAFSLENYRDPFSNDRAIRQGKVTIIRYELHKTGPFGFATGPSLKIPGVLEAIICREIKPDSRIYVYNPRGPGPTVRF